MHLPSILKLCPRRKVCASSLAIATCTTLALTKACGCGFSKDGRDSQELQQCQGNYRALAGLLSSALHKGAKLQLFTCWEGEQTNRPETTGTVTAEELVEPQFELQQLSLLSVQRGA